MPEPDYAPFIRDMTWSWSRVRSFRDCPYRWFLRYIKERPGTENFFSSYGSFVHGLMDAYYKGAIPAKDLRSAYTTRFRQEVRGRPPNQKVFSRYFKDGLAAFSPFAPLPFTKIDTEKEVSFTAGGLPMRGFLDYIGESKDGLVIVDHKSRTLKPRSGRRKPTRSDLELDEYMMQLALYAEAVRQTYGEYPAELCFNCFRSGVLIREPYRKELTDAAVFQIRNEVEAIERERDFSPSLEWFKCGYLCEYNNSCEYFDLFR